MKVETKGEFMKKKNKNLFKSNHRKEYFSTIKEKLSKVSDVKYIESARKYSDVAHNLFSKENTSPLYYYD